MVLDLAPRYSDDSPLSPYIIMGAGCYFGTEKFMSRSKPSGKPKGGIVRAIHSCWISTLCACPHFCVCVCETDFVSRFPNSIKSHKVGFMRPPLLDVSEIRNNKNTTHPPITYKEVCRGKSGYVEVCWLELHDPQSHFEAAVRFFFGFHDPTTVNRQGADRGTQYASILFCFDEEQTRIAERVKDELQDLINDRKVKCFERRKVQTKIVCLTHQEAAAIFVEAGRNHQDYLLKNPNGYW